MRFGARAVPSLVPLFFLACVSATAPAPVSVAPVASATPSTSTSSSASSSKPLPTGLLPGVGMSSGKPPPEPDDEDLGPAPACAKDEDCWSKTCCPAKAPEECVHGSRARKCAIVDIKCTPTPVHYTCICDAGSCRGRLAPI